MLDLLSISNYALIENLEFRPGEGFSILTGDTGAGKSIMLKALSLLAGERADAGMIGDKSRKATVEAFFIAPNDDVAAKIREMDPEWEGDSVIIRREILPSGRSRAFLNDSPVALNTLSAIATPLFDIHSQNATSNLSDPQFQLDLVDAFSDLKEMLEHYRHTFSKYVALHHDIREFRKRQKDFALRKEIIDIKLKKLEELSPKEGELQALEAKFEVLSDSASLMEKVSAASRNLTDEDSQGAVENLQRAVGTLSGVDFAVLREDMADFNKRLHQCLVELKDLSDSLENFLNGIDLDPARLEKIESRINQYNSLIREFKVGDENELIRVWKDLRNEVSDFSSADSDIEEKEKKARNLALILKEKSSEISSLRKAGALTLERRITEEARKLGLENIDFKIRFTETKIGKNGGDSVEFLASINKNQPLSPISKFASGGEMARLMLVIKKITAEKMELPTVIFDEIDSGVSGKIADKMGEMMKQMGETMQILAITHLPQVASKGKRHFKVFKTDVDDKTVSDIKLLDPTSREEEIARMLSGRDINEIAIRNARHLLNEASN